MYITHKVMYGLVFSACLSALCQGIVAPYSNNLNNPNSVAQDFDDYSQEISGMMKYASGNYTVTNNRLEFTTTSSWLGAKTLKTQIGFSSGWSVQVDFHLSPLNNVINGHWYDMGISVSMGDSLYSAFPYRINLKAVQSGGGRKIAASFYVDNTERRGFENDNALATATDGTLKMVFNPNDKTMNCLFKVNGDTVFTSLGIIDLDQSPGWSISPTSAMNLSIFAGSEPYQSVQSFPIIQSGDMYLTNFLVMPWDWIYSVSSNEVTITGYTGTGGAVTIPSEVNGIPVARIGGVWPPVFGYGNTTVTSITIPNTVTRIEPFAFQSCTGLTSVTIPNSVNSLGNDAFYDCPSLTSLTMPDRFIAQVTTIGIRGQLATDYLINALANNDAFVTAVANKIKTTGGNYGIATQSGVSNTVMATTSNLATKAELTASLTQSRTDGINSVLSNPNLWTLYTASQIQNMAMGDLVLTKEVSGQFVLNYDIQQSADLQNWSTYAPLSLPLTGLPTDKAFVRIKMKNSQSSATPPVISSPNPPFATPQ